MYTRIMAVVLAVILMLTAVLSAICFVSLWNQQIDSRLAWIRSEAREIAWLAAQMDARSSGTRDALSWKVNEVYSNYGAYIVVIDRWGRVIDNLQTTYQDNPDFAATLNGDELGNVLHSVLAGGEVSVRTGNGNEATFTVGVPFVYNETVLGGVLIQTPSQQIESVHPMLIWEILLVALAAILITGGILLFYVRKALRPLHQLTTAAVSMRNGDFTARVSEKANAKEFTELSHAFNSMATRLGEVEESRREFVANVSHELRSPITSIRGFAEAMEDGTIPAQDHSKYLGIVADETRRLSRLIDDLLALSRLERKDAELQISNFSISELMRKCVIKRMTDLETKQMEVDCQFPEKEIMVSADMDRIEQVIGNLLDNAIKFTDEGGIITLSVRREGKKVYATISDNGCGINPEDRHRVFDRFYTVDRAHTSGKGTGLGLSICQRIMEMHGESIVLLDTTNGTAFEISMKAVG